MPQLRRSGGGDTAKTLCQSAQTDARHTRTIPTDAPEMSTDRGDQGRRLQQIASAQQFVGVAQVASSVSGPPANCLSPANWWAGSSAAFVDGVVRDQARAGLSSALRSPRLLPSPRYARLEHALWGHARIFVCVLAHAVGPGRRPPAAESPRTPSLPPSLNGGGGALAVPADLVVPGIGH